jgi:Protein of unknown function (DUF1236)
MRYRGFLEKRAGSFAHGFRNAIRQKAADSERRFFRVMRNSDHVMNESSQLRRAAVMGIRPNKTGASRGLGLASAIVISAVGYVLETSSARSASETGPVVVSEEQKPEFLAYVKRMQMRAATLTSGVSAGERLPRAGISYYRLPLAYGFPFYRCAVVGSQTVIVDRFTSVVIQVVE